MEFLLVKGGCFEMGNGFERGDKDEKPIHQVCLDDYYIGKYEVTLKEFEQFVVFDRDAYTAAKTKFIEEITQRAVNSHISL